jgi:predicted ribosomally synthesized peptide with nif11-like leader
MSVYENEITKEQIFKAMQCETADELRAYAKSEGYDITKDEAEAYMAELEDFELEETSLKNVAGGALYERCDGHCYTLDGCGALT